MKRKLIPLLVAGCMATCNFSTAFASELSEDVSVVETSEDSVVAETAPADAEVNNDAVVETANETSDNSS
ncbi:MAG: hypothetical protein K6E79_07570, partial [Pseudobutyrivibrio sp.]|nr:hypothetical protein [Pseudobutyrivibrio sp.]